MRDKIFIWFPFCCCCCYADAVSTPAVVGICLGGTLLLISVAAVSCFCYRGQQYRHGKKIPSGGTGSENRPLAFRKPVAVKSPNQHQLVYSHHGAGSTAAISHHLKKSPSPTGARTPPGSCPIATKTSSPLTGNYSTNFSPFCLTASCY